MEQLVREGKVIYVGSSNFAGWHITMANEIAARRNFLGLVSEQSLYNLKDRMVELEVMPACQHYGLGVIPWSPLAGGLLGGVLKKSKKAAAPGKGCRRRFKNTVGRWNPTKNTARKSAKILRTWRWRGCCINPA
jgi:aryl-alcohol dehydrogenase-like predicted oxidoreductase